MANCRKHLVKRRGNVLVFSAFLMVAMMAFLAFAVDLGYIFVARDQLQRSADAAALASAWELIDPNTPLDATDMWMREPNVRSMASEYAALNQVCLESPELATSDVELGFLSNPWDSNSPFLTETTDAPNAVRIRVRRTVEQNGEVPLFFARALGFDRVSTEAEATAAFLTNIGGFRTPADGGNIDLLPFALDKDTADHLICGDENCEYADEWKWDEEEGIVPGADNLREVNLFPQGTGSPGNRGTVDIGSDNNSTNDIARQILEGISPEDMEYHDNKLEFDHNGELPLNGDTGISAGVKDELQAIMGQPRCIPVFERVEGNGNNAEYAITMFLGIRIMEVKLTGKMESKRVMIQVAPICCEGAIPTSQEGTSHFIYSPVWLVR